MDYTPEGLKFEIRKAAYLKEEYFKVNMSLEMCLRYGHDLAGFLQPAFPGQIEIQNQVERPEVSEGAGRTVDVFGRRLVKVDIPITPATVKTIGELAHTSELGIGEVMTLEQVVDMVPTAKEAIEDAASNNPSLSDLLTVGGLQEAPIPVEVTVKGKPGRKVKG
jgi:hypothetical protein